MSVSEIIPNLWLGNIIISKNKAFYDEHDIKIVINCSKDIPFYCNYTKNIRIPVDDNLKKEEIDRLYKYLDVTSDYINKQLLKNIPILVHCYAGKQRSASIISAYLMKYASMSLKDSILSIQSKRKQAFEPGINFKQALLKFEKSII